MSVTNSVGSAMTQDMPLRTSASHPITLSGIFAWQGKCVNRDGVRHKRSLQQDLKHLQEQYGVTGLVCLLNTAELRSFGLREYAAGVDKAGLVLLSFPIIEMAAPTCIHQTHHVVQQTAQLMAEGHHIAVHCRGGVGRAGLIAACLLLYTQQAATGQEAINIVRRRRCKSAIETARQEEFVCKYARLCQHEQASKPSASSDCTADLPPRSCTIVYRQPLPSVYLELRQCNITAKGNALGWYTCSAGCMSSTVIPGLALAHDNQHEVQAGLTRSYLD